MPDYLDRSTWTGLNFSDKVIKSCRGRYKRVCEHMLKTEPNAPKWMLTSDVLIEASGIDSPPWNVHFFHDGHTVIWDSPSRRLTGPDMACVRAMSIALIAAGWKRPEPSLHEIDANKNFWKQMWETGIVDSRQMTNDFGSRRVFGE